MTALHFGFDVARRQAGTADCPAAGIGRRIADAQRRHLLAELHLFRAGPGERDAAQARVDALDRRLRRLRGRLHDARATSLGGAMALVMEARVVTGMPGEAPLTERQREADREAVQRMLAAALAAIEEHGPHREEVGGAYLSPRYLD